MGASNWLGDHCFIQNRPGSFGVRYAPVSPILGETVALQIPGVWIGYQMKRPTLVWFAEFVVTTNNFPEKDSITKLGRVSGKG